ncbi:UNVERIFIED_CONTAM: hypothetical protein Sradi_6061600 [Sesamum radiatum]|uniref:Uncharacterized protein n=1 Tax=Sesamum radiatum TaxID=300843 RepID=A0AAW2KL53_SESRA
MADEFQVGSGNWWDTSRTRFDAGTTPPASISTTLNAIASFGWPTEMEDMKSRSSRDSGPATGGSMVLHGGHDQSSAAATGGGLGNLNLQMVGLGLSSQGMDWNQTLLGEKGESSFSSMLQEDLSSNTSNYQQESTARRRPLLKNTGDRNYIPALHRRNHPSVISSQRTGVFR